jgi:predicted  nucleic acid-binding Zn-ribbon protein
MAKKNKKKDKKGSDAAEAVEAVRSAIERTFQATSEGAAGTQKRTRALVDEVAHAAARIRETIEDLRVLEDVRGLREEIASLTSRVGALEGRVAEAWPPSRPAPAKASSRPAKPATAKSSAQSKAKPAARAKSSVQSKSPARTKPKPATAARSKVKASPRAKVARAKPAQGS